jgi:dienelactone hydrolase
MKALLALLALLHEAGLPLQLVHIPEPNGTVLNALLVHPAGSPRPPAVVALHGCGGPLPARDAQWAKTLAARGHPVLLPDSFGSRGLGPQCRVADRTVRASGTRRQDAIIAASWLARQSHTPLGGIALLGWSNGGSATLYAAAVAPDLPRGLFRCFVVFYPGCRTISRETEWQPAAPVMILVGANDDWTPAAPCRSLARRFPDRVKLIIYPGAWHDFDRPDKPVRALRGLATPPNGTGVAHVGTNNVARADALRRVSAFIEAR